MQKPTTTTQIKILLTQLHVACEYLDSAKNWRKKTKMAKACDATLQTSTPAAKTDIRAVAAISAGSPAASDRRQTDRHRTPISVTGKESKPLLVRFAISAFLQTSLSRRVVLTPDFYNTGFSKLTT